MTRNHLVRESMPEVYQRASPNARLLAGAVAAGEASWESYARRAVGSVATHIAVLFIIVLVFTRVPPRAAPTAHEEPAHVTWISSGPGGVSGSRAGAPEPPRPAAIARPKPPAVNTPPVIGESPQPPPVMNLPVVTAVAELPGALSDLPDARSLGPGSGGRGGTGAGPGAGPGKGPGLGPGADGGSGGEYGAGNGVTSPTVIREIKPSYTGEAMRARIQGAVTMEAVVMPDGSVGRVHITRSLDAIFGLDQEALRTVKQWRFKPGTRLGQAVPVLVVIELAFTLR